MNAKKAISIVKLVMVCVFMGVFCGVLGALFSKCISLVTNIRGNYSWLLYLLPVAGVLSVAIYKALKVEHMGTNQVIESVREKNVLSPKLAPAVFIASTLSHLCGASVGREGAAIQLGGSSAVFFSKLFRLTEEQAKMLVYCGMAGVFSSVFGTPFAAVFFALEVVYVGHIWYKAIPSVLITSLFSFFTAYLLGADRERFTLSVVPDLSFSTSWKTVALCLFTVVLGLVFCLSLKCFEKVFEKLFKNSFIRIAIGGAAIILLTIAVGTYDYNGAGINVIEAIFDNDEFVPMAFALKMLFTCIAVGAGFKGGEIVPTLFIGATFGALIGSLLGLPIAFSAAVCMVALFCAVTNCPLASLLLGAEIFEGSGIGYMAVAVIISYCISGKTSLYSSQKTDGFKALF